MNCELCSTLHQSTPVLVSKYCSIYIEVLQYLHESTAVLMCYTVMSTVVLERKNACSTDDVMNKGSLSVVLQ